MLPFSTGVIGENLPVDKIEAGLPKVLENLATSNWLAAAEGIMTTDTRPKLVSRQVEINGKIKFSKNNCSSLQNSNISDLGIPASIIGFTFATTLIAAPLQILSFVRVAFC